GDEFEKDALEQVHRVSVIAPPRPPVPSAHAFLHRIARRGCRISVNSPHRTANFKPRALCVTWHRNSVGKFTLPSTDGSAFGAFPALCLQRSRGEIACPQTTSARRRSR